MVAGGVVGVLLDLAADFYNRDLATIEVAESKQHLLGVLFAEITDEESFNAVQLTFSYHIVGVHDSSHEYEERSRMVVRGACIVVAMIGVGARVREGGRIALTDFLFSLIANEKGTHARDAFTDKVSDDATYRAKFGPGEDAENNTSKTHIIFFMPARTRAFRQFSIISSPLLVLRGRLRIRS